MNTKKAQNDFFITVASGIFIGAVCFDIIPEVTHELNLVTAGGFILFGFITWLLLKIVVDYISHSGLAIVSTLAFWFHSFLEGAATALNYSVGAVPALS